MSTKMVVDENRQLQEIRERYFPEQPTALKLIAKLISWVFHPVFVPLYVVYFLTYIHPYLFTGFPAKVKLVSVMAAAAVSFTLFPLITVALLKGLKFIDSIYLRTQKERIIPFIACMTWYFWITYVWFNFGKTQFSVDMPHEAVQFAMACFISTVIGLMVNTKMKVSLHAISMGIVIAFFGYMAFTQELNYGTWFSIVLLIAGMVCTARFIISDHTPAEVYAGIITGMASMLIAVKVETVLAG
ncbi:MAG: hypothetical protein JNM88_15415 [Chitinophagaceae bacterium]|nr:hypothetical protein [Chitinophagaceae bacterium]